MIRNERFLVLWGKNAVLMCFCFKWADTYQVTSDYRCAPPSPYGYEWKMLFSNNLNSSFPLSAGEPVAKRRRISRSSSQDSQDSNISTGGTNSVNGDAHNGVGTTYCGELVMFDRHGRCLLTPGHYELMLEQQVGDNLQLCKSSPKKNASWESIDTLKFDNVFKCIPVLKFSLNWNSENSNSCIERPRLRPLKPLDVVLANSASTKPKPQGLYFTSFNTLRLIKHCLIT